MFEGKAAATADMNARDYPNVPRCYECETPLTVLCLPCNPRTAPLWQFVLAMLLGAVLGIGGFGIAVILTSNPG